MVKTVGLADIVNESVKIIQEKAEAAASGKWGNAAASGKYGAAAAIGIGGKAKAADTGAIMLSEFVWQNGEYKLLNVFASLVGQNGIKANTWYKLVNGKPVECD